MKSSANSVSIKIKNDFSELARVSEVFDQFKKNHPMPLKVTNPVDLALDEIVNNIISYGYDDDKEHEIEVQFSNSDEKLILQIIDDGRPFNPLELKNSDTTSEMEDRAVGGLGIHLIKNMLDKMNYEYKNKKNCLTLYKNIKETKLMQINEEKQGEITILSLHGRLDTLSSGDLDKKMQEITNTNVNQIVIDFSQLDFISSSGLRVLLSAGKKVKSTNGKLVLSSLQDHVKEVFDVAGFTMLFTIFKSQEEALKSLS